jgi:PilZ domain
MSEAADTVRRHRRYEDELPSERRRIGVLWPAEATTKRAKLRCVVLDISPGGAKLRVDREFLEQLERLWLSIDSLQLIECTPVWQTYGRVGVRFVEGQPSMAQLESLVADPPYRRAPAQMH